MAGGAPYVHSDAIPAVANSVSAVFNRYGLAAGDGLENAEGDRGSAQQLGEGKGARLALPLPIHFAQPL